MSRSSRWYNQRGGRTKARKELHTFLDLCRTAQMLADQVPERGADFAESVLEKVEGMQEWAEENQRVTPRMTSAVQNMVDGLERWVRE